MAADLCEILATRALHFYKDEMKLYLALGTRWPIFNDINRESQMHLDSHVVSSVNRHMGSAIELALLCNAKKLINRLECQKFIGALWR